MVSVAPDRMELWAGRLVRTVAVAPLLCSGGRWPVALHIDWLFAMTCGQSWRARP